MQQVVPGLLVARRDRAALLGGRRPGRIEQWMELELLLGNHHSDCRGPAGMVGHKLPFDVSGDEAERVDLAPG